MDERPDEIIGHIEAQRSQLGRNLNELETRVRETADWRTWYDRNPMMVMGAALGGGLLVGSMIGGRSSGRSRRSKSSKNSQRGYRMTGDILGSSTAGVAAGSATHYSGETSSQPESSTGTTWSQHTSPQYLTGQHTSHQQTGGRLKSAVSSLTHSEAWNDVSDTLENVKAALISFGLVKAKEFLNQAIPGFDQHLSDAESKRQGRGGQQQGGTSQGSQSGSQQEGSATSSSSQDDASHSGSDQSSGDIGHHLYTPAGDQVIHSGSYSSDPVGTYRP